MKEKILLLHGAIGAKDQLEPLKQLLKSKYTINTLSFVGHGDREKTNETFSIKLFSEDVVRFLDEHAIDKIKIFGYSMGGYVAMYLAKHHPERVYNIITLGTKFHWTPEIATKEMRMLNAEKIEEKIPKFASILKKRHSKNGWENVLNNTKNLLYKLGENNTLNLEDYSSIHIPIKILLGDKDQMVSKEESINLAEKLINGSFEILPNSDHPIEKVDLQKLITFL